MAIIKCKECGKDISDKAKICVHCGAPLKKGDFHKELSAAKRVAIAIILVLVLIMLGCIIYTIYITK